MIQIKNPPLHFAICCGRGEGPTPLNAFDAALLDAGIGNSNLIKISSIIPSGCSEQTLPELFPHGILLPTAWMSHNSSTPGQTIAAAVAVGLPEVSTLPGVIMEHAGTISSEEAESHVRAQVETAMEIRDIEQYRVKSISITHQVDTCGTVVAAVVLF